LSNIPYESTLNCARTFLQAEPTQLYKSVALKYKDVLTFGLYANPSSQAMQQLQIKKLPQLMIFFSQNGTAESLQVFLLSPSFFPVPVNFRALPSSAFLARPPGFCHPYV